MSHICDIWLVIGVRDKPMEMGKNVDGFSAAL